MIAIQEWKAMSGKEQTLWLEMNFHANAASLAQRKKVYGVGVNDAKYITRIEYTWGSASCPAYTAWKNMMQRCYNENTRDKYPTYLGVVVCDEWLTFSQFRNWWINNHVDGFAMDKDIIGEGFEYSPSSCLFVSRAINNFITDHGCARGDSPLGARIRVDGKYESRCNNPFTAKSDYLGNFDSPEAAHLAWLTRKLELALELKPRMDEIDLRIYARVVEIINNAK